MVARSKLDVLTLGDDGVNGLVELVVSDLITLNEARDWLQLPQRTGMDLMLTEFRAGYLNEDDDGSAEG